MPQENMADYNDMKSFGQFLRSIAVAQNGGEEKNVYAATDCPESLCQTTQTVKAPQGSRFKLHWLSSGGLNYCRLSAYIDLNADGDFEDEGEVLEVYGKKESPANDALNDYVLTVTLPYDLPLGITRIRLRFDSSWASGWDSKTDGMPAKSETKRMVYDIPVLVTDKSSEACTVTVKSADMKQGTADANGQPDTYTYRAGEEIVLRAYPADGYAVDHWTDTYGRRVPQAWSDGNFLRFYAPESGTYTVVFKPATTDGISGVENSAAKAPMSMTYWATNSPTAVFSTSLHASTSQTKKNGWASERTAARQTESDTIYHLLIKPKRMETLKCFHPLCFCM